MSLSTPTIGVGLADPGNDGVELRVTGVVWESQDIVSVYLRRLDGGELPSWEPGSHIDITLPGDVQRQYSLTGDPADREVWRLTVANATDGRGGSLHIHTALRPGDVLVASMPRNNFGLVDAPGYVLISGGIGVTPLLTFARELERRGAPWILELGVRDADHIPLERDLAAFGDKVHIRIGSEGERVDLAQVIADAPEGYALYCCGPEGMLDEFDELCAQRGVVAYRERFAAKELTAPLREGSFTVKCARSGTEVVVQPDESVLDALAAVNIRIESSCREGVCGTCEVAVLAGRVDHRDSLLTPDEQEANDTMMTCVSRALTDSLTLDV